MAILKPFKALRFNKEKIENIADVLCPPYDIIPENELAVYMDKSPYNIIHLERPIGENPYEKAQVTLKAYIEQDALIHDKNESMYIYEECFEVNGEKKAIKGLISGVKLEEFSKKIILPHEETLSKAKEDRLNLMKKTFCNFSLVYSLYNDETQEVKALIDKLSSGTPETEATDDQGLVHRLWPIDDGESIAKLQKYFADKKLFIADGHHRYETAINFRNYCKEQKLAKDGDGVDCIMMMLVDMQNKGLVVFPTHRIVKNVADFSVDKIKEIAKKYFKLETDNGTAKILPALNKAYENNESAFVLYIGNGDFITMTLNNKDNADKRLEGKLDAVKELDVTLLHSLVMEDALGIDVQNLANQTNLEYTRDFDEAIKAVDSKNAQCAFILNPTRIEQIANVANAFGKMPQKSTYFYPKLTTGLVVKDLKSQ